MRVGPVRVELACAPPTRPDLACASRARYAARIMKPIILLGSFLVLALTNLSAQAFPAQEPPKLELPAASPAASFKQRFGVTDVEVEYSRPSAKGRKIFGGLVPYGEVWRTGANSATKLTFSTDVKIEGTAVPAGTYALVTIPGAAEWTVVLNKATDGWGAYAYDEKNDLARFKVKPATLPEAVETMTIDVGHLSNSGARLSISWEKTRVSVQIETDIVAALQPKILAAMKAEGKKPYLQAAMFYFENGLDLKQALAWAEEAAKEAPDAPWVVYRKGLILQKLGDKPAALAAAQKTLELATKSGGAVGAEYKRLGEQLVAALK